MGEGEAAGKDGLRSNQQRGAGEVTGQGGQRRAVRQMGGGTAGIDHDDAAVWRGHDWAASKVDDGLPTSDWGRGLFATAAEKGGEGMLRRDDGIDLREHSCLDTAAATAPASAYDW